jgi:hypothetical protein
VITLGADFGPLAGIVSGATAALAAAGAIGLAFKRRARWEPEESDLPQGPERVSGMIGAVAIAILWYRGYVLKALDGTIPLAIWSATLAVVALLVYVYLIVLQTFIRTVAISRTETKEVKVIGGFWLTQDGRVARRRKRLPIQDIFKGMGYEPDRLWPRPARALAKIAFIVAYMTLTAAGTVALAAAGLLIATGTLH